MYRKILVPLDGSATSERGLREAIALARANPSTLHLLHVIDEYPLMLTASAASLSLEQLSDEMRKQGTALLQRARAQAEAAGAKVETEVRESVAYRVAQQIVECCKEAGCDLIVMGTHGRRGIEHLVLGSDAETVLRTTPVPVLLVRGQ